MSAHRQAKFVLFAVALITYTIVGYWLQVQNGYILGDSLSRVSAAQAVLFSRQPHVAAIGFIFTPLTALLQLPVVWFSPWWPALTESAFAGTLISAPFMAGAVVQIASIGFDRGLPRMFVLIVTAVFALNPMIVFYGANGMSEAPFLFFTVWAVRRLILWITDDDVHHLVTAGGIAMAMAYLTRYDAVACIAVAGFIVAITTYLRAPSPPRVRRALLRLLIVSGPGFLAFIGWAAASWLITGEAFAQFTSQYGNTAILRQTGGGSTEGLASGFAFAAVCITALAPTLFPITGFALSLRWRRPSWTVLLVPTAMYGAILGFQAFSYADGATFGFLRFYIIAVPFAATLAMLAVPEGEVISWKRPGRFAPAAPPVPRTRRPRAAHVAVAIALTLSLPTTLWAMRSPRHAPQEYALEVLLFDLTLDTSDRSADQRRIAATFSTERKVADRIDEMNLPPSSILTDTLYGFAVVAASSNPETFVVPTDTDFVKILNDPVGNGVRYLLTVPHEGRGIADALNQRYPTLYENGAEVATLEAEIHNDGDNQPVWRLYRVNDR
ncbi:ABC transporter [Mycolicibacterium parafortuitum]|nr:ABC transporter [Mycolicibacterium parafortuitum]